MRVRCSESATGGDANWTATNVGSYQGNDCAQCGAIGASQSTWMEMKVCGPGRIKFHWKSTAGGILRFTIDGVSQGFCNYSSWHHESFEVSGLGMHLLRWEYEKFSGGELGVGTGWVDAVQWQPGSVSPSANLKAALDTSLDVYTAGDASWYSTSSPSYYGNDSAQSGYIYDEQVSQMEVRVYGSGTATFWWKVSSEYGDYLEFWLDGVRQDRIDGQVDWQQKSYQIEGDGLHSLMWQYIKDSGGSENDDRGWVDYLQWDGATQAPTPDWQTLSYVYDPSGRRIEKKYDGNTQLTYVYDGDHCIAEYDGNGVLQRKYIYGPGVDEPICMIEGAATSYYHFDALGSVVALSNAAGNTIQVYEYSVWGQVGASDPNHTNPYMFTARRFDKETGLYYYRARYYHPEIGRFLQTDPVGYQAGMNLYRYCSNNPWNRIDPFGCDDSNDTNDVNDSNDSPDSPPAPRAPAPANDDPITEKERLCKENVTNQLRDVRDSKYLKCIALGAITGTTMKALSWATTRIGSIFANTPAVVVGVVLDYATGPTTAAVTGGCIIVANRYRDRLQDTGDKYCEEMAKYYREGGTPPSLPEAWSNCRMCQDPWPSE